MGNRIPHIVLEIYQGESWQLEGSLSGQGAPANLDSHALFMDIRNGSTVLIRLSTSGGEITVTTGLPEFKITIPKTDTINFVEGDYQADLFLQDASGIDAVLFSATVHVLPRVTLVEQP